MFSMYTLVLNHSTLLVYTSNEISFFAGSNVYGRLKIVMEIAGAFRDCLRLCGHGVAEGNKHQSREGLACKRRADLVCPQSIDASNDSVRTCRAGSPMLMPTMELSADLRFVTTTLDGVRHTQSDSVRTSL